MNRSIAGYAWLLLPLLLAAGAVRISFLGESRSMGERQYRSALIARAAYLSRTTDPTDRRRQIAEVSARRMGVLEPPVMETLAVAAYRVAGGEKLWIPRALSSLFWLTGSVFLYFLARRFTGELAALIATAYFLFLPPGVIISISFNPDALMLMLFIASLLTIVRHEDSPSGKRFVLAGVLSAACVLVKPLCLFALAGAFAALRLNRAGVRGLLTGSALLLASVVLVPTLGYYVYGMYISGFLAGQAAASFVPEMLLLPSFWKDTFVTAVDTLGVFPVLLAVLGFAIPRDRTIRPLLSGLAAGHLLLCLVFTYHVRIAGHYHLALAVPLAISLGCAVAALVEKMQGARLAAVRWTCLAAAVVLLGLLTHREIANSVRSAPPIVNANVARSVGEAVRHSDRVVYVSEYYGVPLEYYGELSGWPWPRPGSDIDRALRGSGARRRSIEERLRTLGTSVAVAEPDFEPEYFVITDFREYAHHEDLASFLKELCRPVAKNPRYLIFGECQISRGTARGGSS